MSQQLIDHSPDLKRLRDEGFDIQIKSNFLLLNHVPYVNSNKEVKFGTLVSELSLSGNSTIKPSTHALYFVGEYPCDQNGLKITKIVNNEQHQVLSNEIEVNFYFSSKPDGGYQNYYEKMTTYVAILSGPAEHIDLSAKARIYPVVKSEADESIFNYYDTASSRTGISVITEKLKLERIAIIGLGGTGSYILDLVAKTPVKEIHVFDGDKFSNHNAFRSPGAPSIEELDQNPMKVNYFQHIYSQMHRGIITHGCYIDNTTIDLLQGMSFVFICLDKNAVKRMIIERLEEWNIPFIDVGMGLHIVDGTLIGILRTTTSTPTMRSHVRDKNRIVFTEGDIENEYVTNIQVADLNALNASLAVIKWKKLFGFYQDLESEHHSTYTINCSMLLNDDRV